MAGFFIMDIFSPTNFIAEDANNDALAGAKLYFYDAGTTDVRAVYQDAALTTAHTSPVVADSGGKFAAIYLPEGDFKYTLTDSSDVTIETVDNIPGKTAAAAAVTSAAPLLEFDTQNASVTLTTSQLGDIIQGNSTTADITYTLPSAVTAANGNGYFFKQIGTDNALIIRPSSSQTIEGADAHPLTKGSIWVVSDGANWKVIADHNGILPFKPTIVSRDLKTPPTSINPGDWYIPAATATDAWAGYEDSLALVNGVGGWTFHTPQKGQDVYFDAETKPGQWNGTTWEALPTTDNPSTAPLKQLIVREEQTAGTDGGGFTSGAWQTRTINTTSVNTITGASVATNQITLPVGDYEHDLWAATYACGGARLKLAVISGTVTVGGSSVTEIVGPSRQDNDSAMSRGSTVKGVFAVTAEAVLEVQHWCTATKATNGMGLANNIDGKNEVFLEAIFTDLSAQQGAKGDDGNQGAQGLDAGFKYTLDLTSTTDADPGAGKIRFDAALASATEAYISDTDALSNDISAEILTWDDSTSSVRGKIKVSENGTPANFALYNITGASTDNAGYVTLAITYVTGSVAGLADTDTVMVSFGTAGTGDAGANGADGLIAGYEYNFDSNTSTASDPGSGDFRLNHASFASVTEIAFDDLDANGADVSAAILAWDDSTTVGNKGIIELREFGSAENFAKYQITDTITDPGGYKRVTVSHRASNGSFANTDKIGVLFSPTGDKGTDGAGSVSSASNIGSGEGVFKQLNAGDLEFKTAKATNGASVSSDTDSFTINVPNASTTTAGVIESAIASEVNTGTSTTLAVTPDSLAGSNFGEQVVQLAPFDNSTSCATGDDALGNYFVVPSNVDGMDLVEVFASVGTAGTTGTMDIQIHNVTDTVDMLSTKLTIDSAEVDSSTAATAAVINTANDDVSTGDRLRIDVDAVHSGTAALGLVVTLIFRLP